MPEDSSALSFYKDRFSKMILTRKYVYHPYQVYHGTDGTLGTRTFQSVPLSIHQCCRQIPCFRTLKINGNENSKVFDRRTKLFHQIVLLQTMHPVHGTMGVFAVPDQITWNSKVGCMPIWTEYRPHENKTILELPDFSLFGVSAPLRGAAIAPNHKSKIMEDFSI